MSFPGIGGYKQNGRDLGYFMPVSSLQNIVYAITYGAGSGGTWVANSMPTPVAWCTGNATAAAPYNTAAGNPYLSSINGAGAGILKDLGKTVLSAGRTFRKVQLVVNSSNKFGANYALSTNGVAGQNTYQAAGNTGTSVQDFLTGFIELGFEGTGPSAPVVPYGR
jgi:hypothetical protein